MFSESKEYQELIKISLSSFVWAEVFKRESARLGNSSTAFQIEQVSDIKFQHRGTPPLWVEVMPAFSADERCVWPNNASACGNRGFYFRPIWDAVKGPIGDRNSKLSSISDDYGILLHDTQNMQVISRFSIHEQNLTFLISNNLP
jgi:hypothetical protein